MMRKIRLFFKQLYLAPLYISRIKEYRKSDIPFNLHKGEKAMVFGNAPSLELLIEKYHNKEIEVTSDSFFVNCSPLNEFFFEVKPKHFFLSDYIFSRDGEWTPRNRLMYETLQNRVDWDLTIYITRLNRKECQQLVDYMNIKNPHISYKFIYKRSCDEFESSLRNRLYKTGYFMPMEGTVVNTALWIAILEGYSEVELYGVDTDQFKNLFVSDDNTLYIVDRHYYDGEQKYPVKSDTDRRSLRTFEFLDAYMGMLKSYYLLSVFASYMGTKVYNCSPGSMIDSFDRKNTLE